MKKADLAKVKKLLEEQLQSLQADFGDEVTKQQTNENLADVNDQASLESERSFELRIRDRERKLIAKVQSALRKIADGSYGICESCDEPISPKRLFARPVTTYCINCKSEMEEEEKREEAYLNSHKRSQAEQRI